jgi:hypothetical protein
LHLPPELIGRQAGFRGTKTDALTYVRGLQDNYGNFMMCAIDQFIIDDEGYWRSLAQEIEKKTAPGGIVMGMGSDLYKYLGGAFKSLIGEVSAGAVMAMEKQG